MKNLKEEIRKEYQILSLVCKTARLLLENGSEVNRIEKMTQKICAFYSYKGQCFASLTCVVITLENELGEVFSLVERIEHRNSNLHKISQIDRLVYEIENYDFLSFQKELEKIEEEENYHEIQLILAHMIGAGFFVFLFQGTYREVVVSALTGLCLGLLAKYSKKINLESLFLHLLQGFVCSALPCFFYHISWISNIDIPIISALMIMVPGVAFINTIRDVFSGDLVTAQSRLLEVVLIGMTLAIGSGIALKFFYI